MQTAKTKTTKTTKTEKPTTGQSGPRIKLAIADLNPKERKVLSALVQRPTMTLADLASIAFPKATKANSWVRNSIRRPVCGSLVEKVGAGTYRLTTTARRQLSAVKGAK